MGEWFFNSPQAEQSNFDLINNYNEESFKESLTANAYQTWKTPTKFPCCPIKAKTNMLCTLKKKKKCGIMFISG